MSALQGRVIGIQKFRRQTLKGKVRFTELFESGSWLQGKYLKVVYYQSAEQKPVRFAICVSRSFGNAVKRNRIRRILREILNEYTDSVKSGYYIGFLPKSSFADLSREEQKRQVRTLLLKINREI